MNISKNPAKAYLQGVDAGRTKGVFDGFIAQSYLLMIAMHNVNAEKDFFTDEEFKDFFTSTEAEVQRIFKEEFQNDPAPFLP